MVGSFLCRYIFNIYLGSARVLCDWCRHYFIKAKCSYDVPNSNPVTREIVSHLQAKTIDTRKCETFLETGFEFVYVNMSV